MQPRQRSPLETRKMILLAKTESNYLNALIKGIELFLNDQVPDLQNSQAVSDYLEGEVGNIVGDYNKLSDSTIRFNEKKTLETLYNTAANIRKTIAETHQTITTQIVPILQAAVPIRKQLVMNTLADSCDYKSNISKLHRMGKLERANINAGDYSDLNQARKILREHLKFLQALTFNFTESFIELQRITNNDLRFAGKFPEHLEDDKLKITTAVEKYKNNLVLERQTAVGICDSLLNPYGTAQTMVNRVNSIMEGVNLVPRLPQTDPASSIETKTKRGRSLSEFEIAEIRSIHMVPPRGKPVEPTTKTAAEPASVKHIRPSGI